MTKPTSVDSQHSRAFRKGGGRDTDEAGLGLGRMGLGVTRSIRD